MVHLSSATFLSTSETHASPGRMTRIPSRKLFGLQEILNGSVELKEEQCMLCCHPGKTGQLEGVVLGSSPCPNNIYMF